MSARDAGWRPMSGAPTNGDAIMARRVPEDSATGFTGRLTWWGKTSHVPLYGWCFGDDPEDIDLWRPDEWRALTVEERLLLLTEASDV